MKWTMKTGQVIDIKDMTESHLINAIKMTARAGDINIDLQAEVKRRNLMTTELEEWLEYTETENYIDYGCPFF